MKAQQTVSYILGQWALAAVTLFVGVSTAWAQPTAAPILPVGGTWLKVPATIGPAYFKDSLLLPVMKRELAVYMGALGKPGEPLPASALGVPIGGDFTLPSLAESFAALQPLDGTTTLANQNVLDQTIPWIVAEAPKAHTFSQLFTARTIKFYQPKGKTSLRENLLWQRLDTTQRTALREALDFRRSYDVATKVPANGRPLNYLAVGLLIGAQARELGIRPDDAALNVLAKQCADIIVQGQGMLDDDKQGRGRYDRYGREFAQFTWEALHLLGRKDLQKTIAPHVKRVNQLWLDMVNPTTGYAFPYGRSLQNSWEDTWEQCAFMANNPEVNPTDLNTIVAIYCKSWQHYWAHQYNAKTHLSRMHEPGRGVYSYVGLNRLFTYSVHAFGKAAISAAQMLEAMQRSKSKTFNTTLNLPAVSKWVSIPHAGGKRAMGWWLVRNPGNYLVLPVVGSFKNSAATDYLPVPYGFPGVEFPVSQQLPTLVPHFLMRDGSTLTTAEGADSVSLSADGTTLTMVWNAFTDLKGNLVDPQFQARVSWKWEDKELLYNLELIPKANIVIDAFDLWLPTPYDKADLASGTVFNDEGKIMRAALQADWDVNLVLASTHTKEMGKGAFAPIPLMLQWKSTAMPLFTDRRYKLSLRLQHMGE